MIRIAILGAGRIGQVHAANVARHNDAFLTAVADPVIENAQALTAAWGALR
ncbi:Gfo/Idh/MocA family oxidoreductase [Serratia liquefaciens]|uniref:Gfo/Idh/MocA family oxidoreductase n=1 Tax=Serratia liquefaciens TaxID=614 RepID=UPI002177CF16|nr:Gfo/Idh/MocA family oxidoreductase [Serratia liquefaciens]CAI1519879.1 Oxidoreductase family, NAD-binding Rossmann fold [Serratia liquefaciens]